jgi:hypothetical protein
MRRQQNVLGLDVAVDDAARVGERQRVRYLAGDSQCVGERQWTVAAQAIPQRLSLDVRHDIIEEVRAVGAGIRNPWHPTGVVEPEDVRMVELRGDLNLAKETLGTD